jgi:uroporphyrinogen decarboxylase
MWGGINKHALAVSNEAVDAELARIRPLIDDGGYVPDLDHSMPPDTPFDRYLYYMRRLREITR